MRKALRFISVFPRQLLRFGRATPARG